MMRLVGKHVSKHCPASRPHRSPTPPIKLLHAPIRPACQRIVQHAQTLRRALFVGSSSLLHRAPIRIERRRTLQMRRRIPYPNQPAVMQMRKDGGDSPPASRLPQRRSPPSPSIEVRQKMLIHQITDGISLDQHLGKLVLRNGTVIQTLTRSHRRSPPEFGRFKICHPERSICQSKAKTNAQSKDPACLGATSDIERHSHDAHIHFDHRSPAGRGATTDNSPPVHWRETRP